MLPDSRIRLQAPAIDFETEVGTTGQAHDTFPAPGQARYDWMRTFLIGLLSNQASFDEPIEFRLGTMWFNLNNRSFQFRNDAGAIIEPTGEEWLSLAHGIELEEGLTLAQWYEQVKDMVAVDTDVSRAFSKLITSTAQEPISAGNLVYVSADRGISNADSTDVAKDDPFGVAINTSDTSGLVVVQQTGLARVGMAASLSVTAGDRIYLGVAGRGDIAGSILVGTVFDASVYDGASDDPYVIMVCRL